MSSTDPRMLEFVAGQNWGVLAVVQPGGRPHLSNVGYAFDFDAFDADAQLFRISITESRAKTRYLRADPRVTLHVASKDFWTWVAVEGTAELTPVAAAPDDETVEELVTYYRAINGEHPDWDEYRAAMVADRRLVVRFRPERTYGSLRG
jgi:PPOX class probable F420-dependent enzyme